MRKFPVFFILMVFFCLLAACKSKPAPIVQLAEAASASLVFTGIKAEDPSHLSLSFELEIKDSVQSARQVNIDSWRVSIDGQNVNYAFSLDYPIGNLGSAEARRIVPLRLNMDIGALAERGLAPKDDYSVTLITGLVFGADSCTPVKHEVSGRAEFPGVQAPEFLITSIAILKAELINTRFRVGLKIINPNPYPVELSAFSYELYGNGMFWADGVEKNLIRISGNSAVEGNLFTIMNFIDMNRSLLDQIINLVDVNYRFAGQAEVSTGVEYLPVFSTGFSLSGYSVVLER